MISGCFYPAIPQPFVQMTMTVDGLRPEPQDISFVIDTGASRTIIHALDAIRYLGATPESLEPSRWLHHPIEANGVGGRIMCLEMPATYSLLHDDGLLETISAPILIGEMQTLSLPSRSSGTSSPGFTCMLMESIAG